MQTKFDVDTQTEGSFSVDGFFFSQPKTDILYSYYEEALKGETRDIATFDRMFFLYNALQYDVNIITELRICVKIGMIYVDAFKNRPGYRKILSQTNTIIEKLLNILNVTHDSLEMSILRDYVRVHDLAIANTKRDKVEPIADLLQLPDAEEILPEKCDAGTQTVYQGEDLFNDDANGEFVNTDLQNLEMRFVSLKRLTLQDIQSHKAQTYFTRLFFDLQQDAWRLVQKISREYPSIHSYPLDGWVIRSLGLVLNIQMAYITFLDMSQATEQGVGKNLRKIAKAFQLMAQLVRIFNSYYQNTNEPELSKKQMGMYVKYIQDKALNAKEVLTYKNILACNGLTDSQKSRLDEKYQLFQELQVKDLIEMFKSFHNLRVDEKEPDVSLDKYETFLRQELKNAGNNLEVLSNLLRKATCRLNLVTSSIFPSAMERMTAFSYIDGKILANVFDYISESDLDAFDANNKLKLLLILDLYYKIKVDYLDAYMQVINDKELIEFFKNERFASQFRKDAYRFLLLDNSSYAREDIVRNCDDLLQSTELSTPLIHDLVLRKLQNLPVDEKLEVSDVEVPVVEKAVESSQVMIVSKVKSSSNKPKIDILEDLIAEFGSMYILQSAPGWSELRSRCKTLIVGEDYEPALSEINAWLYNALQDEEAETISYKRSIFEALFYRATIEKLRGNYIDALSILDVLSNYVVPQTYRRTYCEQVQQILCERGAIYKLQQRLEEANACFVDAIEIAKSQNLICFPSVLQIDNEEKEVGSLEEYLQKYIKYLENLPPILIDDYSLPYFHEFYTNIMDNLSVTGLINLNKISLLLSGGRANTSDNTSVNHLKTALKIGKLLLNTRFDERSYVTKKEIILLLAKVATSLNLDLVDSYYHKEALFYVNELEKYRGDFPSVSFYIDFLKGSLHFNSTSAQRIENKKKISAFESNLSTKFARAHADVDNSFIVDSQISDPEEAHELMIEAIKVHTIIDQIRGFMVSVYQSMHNDEKSQLSLVLGNLEKIIKQHHTTAATYYAANIEKKDAELANRYLRLEKIYSMKQLTMKSNDKFDDTSGIILASKEMDYQAEIDKSKAVIAEITRMHKRIKYDSAELSSIVSPLADSLQISSSILVKLKTVCNDSFTFKGALMQLQEKRYWVAHACFNSCLESGNKMQTKASHYFLGKITSWVLAAMTSEFITAKLVGDLFTRSSFLSIFNELKETGRRHFNAARNCSAISESYIAHELGVLKELGNSATMMHASVAVACSGSVSGLLFPAQSSLHTESKEDLSIVPQVFNK